MYCWLQNRSIRTNWSWKERVRLRVQKENNVKEKRVKILERPRAQKRKQYKINKRHKRRKATKEQIKGKRWERKNIKVSFYTKEKHVKDIYLTEQPSFLNVYKKPYFSTKGP